MRNKIIIILAAAIILACNLPTATTTSNEVSTPDLNAIIAGTAESAKVQTALAPSSTPTKTPVPTLTPFLPPVGEMNILVRWIGTEVWADVFVVYTDSRRSNLTFEFIVDGGVKYSGQLNEGKNNYTSQVVDSFEFKIGNVVIANGKRADLSVNQFYQTILMP